MRPTRWSVPILMAVALVGLSLAPKPIGAQIRPPEVTNVRFEGNETFPDDSLARAIVTRETNCRSTFFFFLCPLGFDFALDRSELR